MTMVRATKECVKLPTCSSTVYTRSMCFMCIKDPSNTVLGRTDSRRIYDGQIKLRDKYSDDGFHFVTSKSIGVTTIIHGMGSMEEVFI